MGVIWLRENLPAEQKEYPPCSLADSPQGSWVVELTQNALGAIHFPCNFHLYCESSAILQRARSSAG